MFIRSALVVLFLSMMFSQAHACGSEGNTPEKLAQRQKERFENIDKNHDNVLSVEEYVKSVLWCHAKYEDKNHDGIATQDEYDLSVEECEIMKETDPKAEFKSLDKDANGNLSFKEWAVKNPMETFATFGC